MFFNFNALATDQNGCTFGMIFTIDQPDLFWVDLFITQAASNNDGSVSALIQGGLRLTNCFGVREKQMFGKFLTWNLLNIIGKLAMRTSVF